MSTTKQYLVIVHKPRTGRDLTSMQYTAADVPRINRTRAASAEEAARKMDVPPGGYAEVVEVEHVRRFDRAEKAPLVEREPMALNQTGD